MLFALLLLASQPRIDFAPSGVEAGDVVTVGWENLPADVEELEFLLVRNDGRAVRLTPQLPPSRGSFRWTVPMLPSRAARLVLRAGIGGEEITLAMSQPFAIHAAANEYLEFRDNEWWSYEMRRPADDAQALHRTAQGELHVAPFITPSRPDRLKPVLQWAAAHCGGGLQPAALGAASAETRSAAPLAVPQRK